jgi:hypothetical protein
LIFAVDEAWRGLIKLDKFFRSRRSAGLALLEEIDGSIRIP